jgi:hypothetical protein
VDSCQVQRSESCAVVGVNKPRFASVVSNNSHRCEGSAAAEGTHGGFQDELQADDVAADGG